MPEKSQPLIWHSLNIFRALCCRMEHERAVALGGKLGSLVARLSRRKVAEAVERCMKILGVPRARAEEIVRGAYEHFGRAAAEFARMPVMAERIDELVSSEGHEYLFDAVKSGRGAMLATAHIGNWEYSACWLAHHGLPINSLGADQRDERITELIKGLRRAGGAKALKGAPARRGHRRPHRPGREGGGRRLALPRLSREHSARSSEARGEARLRRDSWYMHAQPRRRHLLDEILPADEGPRRRALRDLNAVISEGIKAHPEQWMWMYPRWESVERGIFNDRGN